ncbi:MAG: discoidin domain-containing protein [Spirochaetales bacterium]|nr:discoidin domain-containing protein [Spirochaetales bacterium]
MKKSFIFITLLILALVFLGTCVTMDPTAGLTNAAIGKSIEANNHIYDFKAVKAVDDNNQTYWEGAKDAYPNELTVDLGSEMKVGAIKILLNPKRVWQPRTQTFSILGSADGTDFSVIKDSAGYDFTPMDKEHPNMVTIPVSATVRYVRLSFTANTEATAGQVAEFQVFVK